jgi:hypothetical protein
MKYFALNIPCPHCGAHNRIFVDPPRRYDATVLKVKCFDTDSQKGCLKDFNLNQQINAWATLTKEQKELEQKKEAPKKMADRMGGS